ncbi:uncharacterized protein (DUF2252 family) [Nitrosospira sp. Nsp2]|uniref:DUF2252 family protein n=1 Tax=Nitrosospira sp. Nsp2 TaxID=136548 RepID=UPI000D3137A2|nr:DUF2252 family protein [Nitrosospira sp. Nsp2]PTR16016.1 uncharacterized protein (DUF2252 family) [Nitrosospira sp. Nsp2]
MKSPEFTPPAPGERKNILSEMRNRKMARSPHAYVRGNTAKFYEWLEEKTMRFPSGPAIWICGDCHLGNLGPIANHEGEVDIQIRDLDQAVIGNPAHDLIRLGLSLASVVRGSGLPGVITAQLIEHLMSGYEHAFDESESKPIKNPASIKIAKRKATRRTWKELAIERLELSSPLIPLGKNFWPLSREERAAIEKLFEQKTITHLATSLNVMDDNSVIKLLDAAYWQKGCSSLGNLRNAVLLYIKNGASDEKTFCLMDIKEATLPVAPKQASQLIPREHADRVVTAARHLSPYLGERMAAARLLDTSVFLRELLPQDMKIEVDSLTEDEAKKLARYLAAIVGRAHLRQMDVSTKKLWFRELQKNRFKTLDAPSWLWTSIVHLITNHEGQYLEHCRKYSVGKNERN